MIVDFLNDIQISKTVVHRQTEPFRACRNPQKFQNVPFRSSNCANMWPFSSLLNARNHKNLKQVEIIATWFLRLGRKYFVVGVGWLMKLRWGSFISTNDI